MIRVEQFLKALAMVESSDDPEAWGDGGRAMGRWQVHPDRYEYEIAHGRIQPKLGQTWDQRVATILCTLWAFYVNKVSPVEIAMYWHVGHWVKPADSSWDAKYAARFEAALLNAQEEMP